MSSAAQRPVHEKRLIVFLDREDRRALLQLAKHEKLTLSDTVRRIIRAAARRVENEKQRATA